MTHPRQDNRDSQSSTAAIMEMLTNNLFGNKSLPGQLAKNTLLNYSIRKASEGCLDNDDRPTIDFIKFEDTFIKGIRELVDAKDKVTADKLAAAFEFVRDKFMRYDQIRTDVKKEFTALSLALTKDPSNADIQKKIQNQDNHSKEILKLYQDIREGCDTLSEQLQQARLRTPAGSGQRFTPDD